VRALGATLERALVDDPPAVIADGGFIAFGFHAELDEYFIARCRPAARTTCSSSRPASVRPPASAR
jgi:hypothetical protein